jgi:hypothetical protein
MSPDVHVSLLLIRLPFVKSTFKGTVSRDGYFFGRLNILIGTFCVCADGFQGLRKAFHYPIQYTIINFLFASLNLLTNLIFKMITATLLRISFSVISRCTLVLTSHWLQGKCARIILSPAAFGIILQNYRRLPVSIYSVKIKKYIFIIISL